jgi:hypothetical protein
VPEQSLRKRGKSRKKPKRRGMTGAGRREQFSHPALKELEPCTASLADTAGDEAAESHPQPITTVCWALHLTPLCSLRVTHPARARSCTRPWD